MNLDNLRRTKRTDERTINGWLSLLIRLRKIELEIYDCRKFVSPIMDPFFLILVTDAAFFRRKLNEIK